MIRYSYNILEGNEVDCNKFKDRRAYEIALTILNNSGYFLNPQFIKRADGAEIILFTVDIEVYQNSRNGIKEREDIAIICIPDSVYFPSVFALRSDFRTGLPHTFAGKDERPVQLCVTEKDFQESKLQFNALDFIESIRRWLSLTAENKLHAEDQILEPFIYSKGTVILPRNFTDIENPQIEKYSDNSFLYKIKTGGNSSNSFFSIPFHADAQTHGFIRKEPQCFTDLNEIVKYKGVTFTKILANYFSKEQNQDKFNSEENLFKKIAIICLIPVKRNDTDTKEEETSVYFFVTKNSLEEIFIENGALTVSEERIGKTPIEVFNVTSDFDINTASLYNGIDPNKDKYTLIGTGALGSQVLALFARMGYGEWTIIDKDDFFPHNLARHFLSRDDIGFPKVNRISEKLNSLLNGDFCKPVYKDFLNSFKSEDIVSALSKSRSIIDISTSISVARVLARDYSETIKAPRISAFLNPSGTDLVVLAEDRKRKYRLDFIEMEYYRFLYRNENLHKHLFFNDKNKIRYNRNSCRDISSKINQADVMTHASICSKALMRIIENGKASISIWSIDPETLTIINFSISPTKWIKKTSDDWSIYINKEMLNEMMNFRMNKLPNETGGVLLGSYDYERKIVYVFDTIPAPEDSEELRTSYIRGCKGVFDEFTKYQKVTDNQIKYLGEWHSHPREYSTKPSGKDLILFEYLSKSQSKQCEPTLMLILGDKREELNLLFASPYKLVV